MLKIKKNPYSFYSIVIIVIAVIWINLNHKLWENHKSVIKWDVINYYQYLPATFYYNDLSLKFIDKDPTLLEWKFWPHISPIGKYTGKMSMGLSFMYLPFYLLAHLQAYLTNQSTDGFSAPFTFWLIFSSLFYVFVGMLYLRKLLLKYFTDGIVALTVLSIFFGTNLLFYTTLEAPMPHAYLFSLFSIFIYYTIEWHESINFKNSMILGLLLGLIALIRPSDSIIIIFFAFYQITSWSGFYEKLKSFVKNWKYLMLIALFSFIVWIPQLIYWKYTTGNYFYFSYQNEGFFFDNPQIIKGLFGFRKGWFVYTPLLFFAVSGIFLFFKDLKKFFLPIFIFTFLNVYIILSWWCWWYGGTYGQRVFIESYAILSIPFALFISNGFKYNRLTKILTIVLLIVLSAHQIFQTIKFNYNSIHYDAMTKEAYFNSYFKIRPSSNFESLLRYPDYQNAVFDNNNDTKPAVILKKTIIIKASNGKYISDNSNNNNLLFANKENPCLWETFTIILLDNGKCGIISYQNMYLSAMIESKNEITATISKMAPWETFELQKIDNNHFAIKAINDKYLTCDSVSNQIFANAKTIGKNEIFEIIVK
jgi:hypothetical protein